jgi:RecA-family ATPase
LIHLIPVSNRIVDCLSIPLQQQKVVVIHVKELAMNLINWNTVTPEEVQWLWKPYIPLGKLTLIQGDPGEGKTTSILAIAAALTKGLPFPECQDTSPPSRVVFQSAEDTIADTLRQRFDALGGTTD